MRATASIHPSRRFVFRIHCLASLIDLFQMVLAKTDIQIAGEGSFAHSILVLRYCPLVYTFRVRQEYKEESLLI